MSRFFVEDSLGISVWAVQARPRPNRLQEFLESSLPGRFWGNSTGDWVLALGVLLITIVIVRLVKGVVLRRLERWADRSATNVDNIVIETFENTRWYFYIAIALFFGSRTLELPEKASMILDKVTVIAVLLQLGLWLQTAVSGAVTKWRDSEAEAEPGSTTMAAAVAFVSRLIIWSLVVLLVLSNLGVEISALIAGLGVGGVAAALAVQSLLGDVFSSLSIYFDRPFDIGDFIIVDDYMGSVEKIGLRTTRLRSLGGEQIIFANSDLTKSRIRNYRRMSERRIVFTIGIEYNLPVAKVELVPKILREAIESVDECRFDRAHFRSYGDFSLVFEAVYYVLSPDYNVYMDKQQAINFHILKRFEAEGIPFAFPSRTLFVRQDGGWRVGARDESAADSASRQKKSRSD